MALDASTKRVDYVSVDRLIHQPTLDSNYVSVAAYVNKMATGGSFANNKTTPLVLANMLEEDCTKALALVTGIN